MNASIAHSVTLAARTTDSSQLLQSVISLDEVKKTFSSSGGESIDVIEDITRDINQEEFVSIVGQSGSGKSTMFNIIVGLLEPIAGPITLSGHDPKRGARVGYMLQRDLLFPWRTIIDNVCLGLEVQGISKARRYEIAHDYLARYGMADFVERYRVRSKEALL